MNFEIKILKKVRSSLITSLSTAGFSLVTHYTVSAAKDNEPTFVVTLANRQNTQLFNHIKSALEKQFLNLISVSAKNTFIHVQTEKLYKYILESLSAIEKGDISPPLEIIPEKDNKISSEKNSKNLKSKVMHINEQKDKLVAFLKAKGCVAFKLKKKVGDFQILLAHASKQILVLCKNPPFLSRLTTYVPELENLIDCKIQFDGHKCYLTNKDWQTTERKKAVKENPGDDTNVTSQQSVDNDTSNKGEMHVVKSPDMSKKNITCKLEQSIDRLEDLLDEFRIHRLSLKEMLGNIYDSLKLAKVEVYTTDVDIIVNGDKMVIPKINKEAFISIALKALREDANEAKKVV